MYHPNMTQRTRIIASIERSVNLMRAIGCSTIRECVRSGLKRRSPWQFYDIWRHHATFRQLRLDRTISFRLIVRRFDPGDCLLSQKAEPEVDTAVRVSIVSLQLAPSDVADLHDRRSFDSASWNLGT